MWQELKWWRTSWSWGIFFFKVLFLGHSVMLGTFQIIVVTQLTAVWSIFDIAYALRLPHLSALRGWRTLTLPTRPGFFFEFNVARSLWLPMFFLLLFYQDPSPLTSWTGARNPASSIWAEKSSEHIRISNQCSHSWSWELSPLNWRSASFSMKTEWVEKLEKFVNKSSEVVNYENEWHRRSSSSSS